MNNDLMFSSKTDQMTDEFLPECLSCPDHVNKAQDDLEAWNRRAGELDG